MLTGIYGDAQWEAESQISPKSWSQSWALKFFFYVLRGIRGHGREIRVQRITHHIFKMPPCAALQLENVFPPEAGAGRGKAGWHSSKIIRHNRINSRVSVSLSCNPPHFIILSPVMSVFLFFWFR